MKKLWVLMVPIWVVSFVIDVILLQMVWNKAILPVMSEMWDITLPILTNANAIRIVAVVLLVVIVRYVYDTIIASIVKHSIKY